jgi:hypothetical protein
VQLMAGKVHQACAEDIYAGCADVQIERVGIMRCLNNHKNERSPECSNKAKDRRLSAALKEKELQRIRGRLNQQAQECKRGALQSLLYNSSQ